MPDSLKPDENPAESDESRPGYSSPINVDTRIMLMNSAPRRKLITIVAEHECIEIREASEIITAEKEGLDRDEVTYDDQSGIYSMLHQNHVPTLVEHGIIEKVDSLLFATSVTHDFAELVDLLTGFEIGGVRE